MDKRILVSYYTDNNLIKFTLDLNKNLITRENESKEINRKNLLKFTSMILLWDESCDEEISSNEDICIVEVQYENEIKIYKGNSKYTKNFHHVRKWIGDNI